MNKKISISLPEELLNKIKNIKGYNSVSAYIRIAIEKYIK